MRYLLIAIGTRGDIEPFLALGQLLQANEQEVQCIFPAQFEALTISAGLDFSPLDHRFLELLETEAGRGIMGQKGGKLKRLGLLFNIARQSWSLQKTLVLEQQAAVDNFLPDRIIYHPKAVLGRIWGMDNPNRSWMLSPIPNVLHPSQEYSHIGISKDLGKWGNRLTYRLTNYVTARMTNSMAKQVASHYPRISYSTKNLLNYSLKKLKVIYPISTSLFTPPKEWPQRAQVTGYLERNKVINWQPSDELVAFLNKQSEAKRPIVFITFGSMVNARPEHNTQLIIKVLEASPYAAIINTSSGGLQQLAADSERIFFTSDIPYDFIFSRVKAVIHHGGSGTTHTAIKHGCASMILPHIIDQFFWNRRIAALGAGPLGVKISKLNTDNFSKLLHELMENDNYRSTAQRLGQQMQSEDAEAGILDILNA